MGHTLMVQGIKICFAPYDRGMLLISGDQICNAEFRGSPWTIALNRKTILLRLRKLDQKYLGNVQAGFKFTYTKPHTCFPLVPKLVTFNDFEWQNGCYFVDFSRGQTVKLVEVNPCCLQQNVGQRIYSSNISLTAILWESTVKEALKTGTPT